MTSVTITNLITNPLFSSGTGWQGYDGVSGGVMYKTTSSWDGWGASSAIADISGHKYYSAVSVKVSVTNTDCRWGLGTLAGGGNVFYAPSFSNKSTSSFLRNSEIRTSGASQNVYFAYYVTGTSTRIDSNGALYIDLTACFGAGKEPDIAWCDTFIPFFSGSMNVNLGTTNHLKFCRRTRFPGSITGA